MIIPDEIRKCVAFVGYQTADCEFKKDLSKIESEFLALFVGSTLPKAGYSLVTHADAVG